MTGSFKVTKAVKIRRSKKRIPGAKNKERIIENLDSAKVELTDTEFTGLEGK